MGSITLEHVNKTFGGHQVIPDVSLQIADGEFVVFVGPSGCGKSTLLNLISGLDTPNTGEILVEGSRRTGPGPDRAVVFQEGALFPWLSVLENVTFGLRLKGFGRAEREEKARAMLERLGLAGFENRFIHELSGGMRQRVAIARAMALDPQLVLMDEPFSALDAMTREDLYALLQGVWTASETTVVFVTHNIREAVTLGDVVALMSPRPGRMIGLYPVDLPRPRRIDDPEVASIAKELSDRLKAGAQ